MSETPKINAAILISGERPGSGQTTVAKYIAEKFALPRHYAGRVRRSAAVALNLRITGGGDISTFVELISRDSPHMPIPLLSEEQFNEQALVDFGTLVARPDNWPLLTSVERLIDRSSVLALAEGKPVVIEGKLAVIASEIFPVPNTNPIPTLRFLLEAPPIEVTAQRVLDRRIANGEVIVNSPSQRENLLRETTDLLKERDKQDWKRYGQAHGIAPRDLRRPGVNIINANRPLDEVLGDVDAIIDHFSQTLVKGLISTTTTIPECVPHSNFSHSS